MAHSIQPVLLCGGSGTRLWPLSRKSYPKQFSRLIGEHSLFQATAQRLSGQHGDISFAAPMVVANSDHRFIVTEQLAAAGVDPGPILLEPTGRNTAPAILAAAQVLAETDPETLMLVAPSDHLIPDPAAFRAAVARGVAPALAGQLVLFGVTPDRPETGYGYLELSEEAGEAPCPLKSFVEKPPRARAEEMLAARSYLWNMGCFLFRVRDVIAAFDRVAPDFVDPVARSVAGARTDLGFLRLEETAWEATPSLSIDYSVMEKSDNLTVVPFSAAWDDLGQWDAVRRAMGPDETGTAAGANATAIDCRNSLLRADSDTVQLVGIGLDGIIAVATGDAVLVAAADRAQEVSKAVETLRAAGAEAADDFPKVARPWGSFERLAIGDRFQVKRIIVDPGASLSLQSHFHRAEHWVVVQGTAKCTIGDEVKLVTENESVYVPIAATHRLENPGKLPVVLIEIQTGGYVGEDDIVRYEDIYAR